jgi:hypothetical protein
VDLSGVIFVALAIAWAAYLIPQALQQHDELARTRSVDSFSSRLRVFGGHRAAGTAHTDDVVVEEDVAIESVRETVVAAAAPLVTRTAARRAAARRRRVLGVLTVLLLITVALAALSLVGWWVVAVPAAMIVAFLVIARLSVCRQRAARVSVMTPAAPPVTPAVPDLEEATEDTIGVSRSDLAAAGLSEQPVADEGSLWDPLPVTLPTYVTKPAARRTVRTIELTRREVTSSGHDAGDSQLVREAEAAAEPEVEATEQRRVAGA